MTTQHRESTQTTFQAIVESAAVGRLRLPEFQRGSIWGATKVIRLYDSIRNNFPIGSFLTLEVNDQLDLSPRLLAGVNEDRATDRIQSYVLDGQQRLTAGLALYMGLGDKQYFLDLNMLWNHAVANDTDFTSTDSVRSLVDSIDADDRYIKAYPRIAAPRDRLRRGLLSTSLLVDFGKFSDAKEQYVEHYTAEERTERTRFMDRVIWTHFELHEGPIVPVTVLGSRLPIEAITRVFETINTSGQKLTAIEIVAAVLYKDNIRLRRDLDDFIEKSAHYRNIDSSGELLLQTIALLEDANPKRSALPRTITASRYTNQKNAAHSALHTAGVFLSDDKRFRAGIDRSVGSRKGNLIAYPAMLPPLGIALASIHDQYAPSDPERELWYRALEKWYVGTILERRYLESQPTTQARDTRELTKWISDGRASIPEWLDGVRVPQLSGHKPSSAIGKLMRLLIGKLGATDPISKNVDVQNHHIFPEDFCEKSIRGWASSNLVADDALNIMPVTGDTNRMWSNQDPATQVEMVRSQWPDEYETSYQPFFVNGRCLELMEKRRKSTGDYEAFLREREHTIQEYIKQQWGFLPAGAIDATEVEADDDEDEEES